MKTSLHYFSPLICLLASPFIGFAANSTDTGVIARSGETTIKVDEIRPMLANLDANQLAALTQDPAQLDQLVRTLLAQKILLKEATSSHWEQQADIAAKLEQLRQQAIAESYLKSAAKPPEGFPTDAELQSAYQANKNALLIPRQYHLSQIYIAIPRNADKATLDKLQLQADALYKKLRQPDADFSALARSESAESESAKRGGEIGWVRENQLQPEIRTPVTGLAKNGISEPIHLNDGWHILKVLEIKEPYTPSLDEIRSPLTQQLRAARQRSDSQAYLA
ncbi:MAG: peptidylprolyl isomerase, partial [Chthoniobacterales bacterium]